MKIFTALLSGTLFGAGLAIADMTDPAKIQAFLDVAGDALAVHVHGRHVVLRAHVALLRSALEVAERLALVARYAAALIVEAAERGLGLGIAVVCAQGQPLHGTLHVPAHAHALAIQKPELALGLGIAGLGGLPLMA